jgi:hypothetical protein
VSSSAAAASALPELGFACGGVGELEVVADGAVEDVRVLGDQCHVHGPPADGSQDGRLAGSRGAGEQHGVACRQRELDALSLDLDRRGPGVSGAGRVRGGGGFGEQLGQASGGGPRPSEGRDGGGQADDGLEDGDRDETDSHEGGRRERPCAGQAGGGRDHREEGQVGEEAPDALAAGRQSRQLSAALGEALELPRDCRGGALLGAEGSKLG